MRLWDLQTSDPLLPFEHRGVMSAAFSPDGRRVVTGGSDKTAKVWDAKTGEELLKLEGHTRVVRSVAFSSDGEYIVTGSIDSTAKVWNAQNGAEVQDLVGHQSGIVSVAFSPDGSLIATGSEDKTMKVWEVSTGRCVHTLEDFRDQVTAVCFSPDGRYVVAGGQPSKVWDSQTGDVFSLTSRSGAPHSVMFTPDATRILVVSSRAEIWDAETRQVILSIPGSVLYSPSGDAVLSRDGKRLLTGMLVGGHLAMKAYHADKALEGFLYRGHEDVRVTSLAFGPDGRHLFGWDDRGNVVAWDAERGTPTDPGNAPARTNTTEARSPNGDLEARVSGDKVGGRDLRLVDPKANTWPLPDVEERKRFHTEEAAFFESQKKWFAVAFHIGRVLLDDPDNAELKKRREEALAKHFGQPNPAK